MSTARHHAEWLSLVETSGPFLSMPVLLRVFPQGLEQRDAAKAARLREAYQDWLERGAKTPAVHYAWIRHVLTGILEYPAEFLVEGQAIPPGMEAVMANYGETLRPEFVLKNRDTDKKPLLLIEHYSPEQDLEKPVAGKIWKASPGTRMMELLHATDVPLGLVTNGEQWMIVYAPRGETTGFASWYADLWMQEPLTLRAFHSLLHLRRFMGVAEPETLAALYSESSKDQQEVTDQLGYQVRRAVEMLVSAFDRIDAESERKLLADVSGKDLYNSALTVMMRLVFLFSADERGLLLLGDPFYDQNYAVSTLSELLRERADQHGEEILERRHDAWCRLLATFRAVHGGVEHEAMRLPPYGGTLFDPDRFPFLEGRTAGTNWRATPAKPLPINNRVVLHLLEAMQVLRVKVPGGGPAEARRISFRALDIEQIGHVYEGLLDHTAKRASEVILGLAGAKNSETEIPLTKLEELATTGTDKLIEFLAEETGRSEKTLRKFFDATKIETPQLSTLDHQLLVACGQDPLLAKRIKPFGSLLRDDDFGRLVVIPAGSVFVTSGSDRRSTGTHYTPRSLTEPIVQHTLEPLVYIGPAEGKPKAEWKLKSPREILALKVCDMAMGSGAFLVQTCRYLGERLVEAWENAERANPGKILSTPDGDFSDGDPKERLIPADPAERLAIARRYVADRCLYGVDINPMAVEMAKLSLWLITVDRKRPFTFLDHAFKCGDSLLGVSSVQQIENFSLRPDERQVTFATANLFRYVEAASAKRRELEDLPSNEYTQIEIKNRLHAEAEAATAKVKALADALIAFELRGLDGNAYAEQRTDEAEKVQLLMKRDGDARIDISNPKSELARSARENLRGRRPFHWPVEFPEVFARGGFDAFVGNPPFMGGRMIGRAFSQEYHDFLGHIRNHVIGSPDLCAYFLLRAFALIREKGAFGLMATKTIAETGTRTVCLDQLLCLGATIYRADSRYRWPGQAAVFVAVIHICNSVWSGELVLDGKVVASIDGGLDEGFLLSKPHKLPSMSGRFGQGQCLMDNGGFQLDQAEKDALIAADPKSAELIMPLFNGKDLNNICDFAPSRWVINFRQKDETEARSYAAAFKFVEQRVRKYREGLTGQIHERSFWRFWDYRSQLVETLSHHTNVLASSRRTKYVVFRRVPTNAVYTEATKLFLFFEPWEFAVLQSNFHQEWAAWRSATLGETTFAYSTSEALETWPMPQSFSDAERVRCSAVGDAYHDEREGVIQTRGVGLTDLYNRFHDRGEAAADIARLRALHVELDQAVAAAYGWSDLDLGHGFHATKQGERYTISETARRTVLDRLLALNHQRYAEEIAAGQHDKSAKKAKTARRTKVTTPAQMPPELGLDFGQSAVVKPKLDAAATALVLIPYLLSEASRAKVSLRMTELKLAFDFITNPTLMKSSAKPADRMAVEAWVGKWQSPAGPEWFIKTLRQLAGGTVKAASDEDDPSMSLVVAPMQPESPEFREGLRLAVRVARSADELPTQDRIAVIRERHSIFANM